MDEAALRAKAARWIADDPDPRTAAELQALLDAGDLVALGARFAAPLGFGTAGLRGALGAGPGRMNRAVVARTTAAVSEHLIASVPDARARGLCIGFDARHGSAELAEETAAVAAGAGLPCHCFEQPGPTPLLAFAVRKLGAAGGVMITASHNPAGDNGYKLYLEHGAQLGAPDDAAIAARMAAVASVRALPRVGAAERGTRGLQHPVGAALEAAYLAAIESALPAAAERAVPAPSLRIAYTALHGVGERLARTALARAGFADVESVPEQAAPDPDFPTVAFPNPEEPGAMDRVLALGERIGAQLVLANDPDADRLAVAGRAGTGELAVLHGNEVGVLLADFLLAQGGPGMPLVLSSIVSTPMIASVAAAHGARYEPTLTGFKWICARARELESPDLRFVLGFEEALGYAIGTAVRDKDGIAAAVAVARLAAHLALEGTTLHSRLEALYRAHGCYQSAQVSVRLDGPDALERAAALMASLRSAASPALAGRPVIGLADLLDGRRGTSSLRVALPRTDLLLWDLDGGDRVAFRPSGTEPKLKVYLDVAEPVGRSEPVTAAVARARSRLATLEQDVRALLG
jgi:phosphomannomutase